MWGQQPLPGGPRSARARGAQIRGARQEGVSRKWHSSCRRVSQGDGAHGFPGGDRETWGLGGLPGSRGCAVKAQAWLQELLARVRPKPGGAGPASEEPRTSQGRGYGHLCLPEPGVGVSEYRVVPQLPSRWCRH